MATGHIVIAGTEAAGRQGKYESYLGESVGTTQIATEEGMRASSRAASKPAKTEAGFGKRRVEWSRPSVPAYIRADFLRTKMTWEELD